MDKHNIHKDVAEIYSKCRKVFFESDAFHNMDAIEKDLSDENSTIRKFMEDYKVGKRGYIVPRKNKNSEVKRTNLNESGN